MAKYYRAHITYGSKFKKKQREKIIFVQTPDTQPAPASAVLDIIRKIPFGRMISVRNIERDEYIKGVSRSNG